MRLNILLLFISSIIINLSAQQGIYQVWSKTLENNAGEAGAEFFEVNALSDGSAVIGNFSGKNGSNYMLARYDDAGNELWKTQISTSTSIDDDHFQLTTDSDGNFYVAGVARQDFLPKEAFVAKIDPSGNLLWQHSYFDQSKSDYLYALSGLRNLNDGILVFGYRRLGFDEEGFLSKLNNDGNEVWTLIDSSASSVMYMAADINSSGNIAVAGGLSDDDGYLLKMFDKNGSQLWQFPDSIGFTPKEQFLHDVKFDQQGNVYVTGFESPISFVNDISVIKFSPSGTLQWKKKWTNNDENSGKKILIGQSGNIYVACNIQDDIDYSAMVLSYDFNGNELWDYSKRFDNDAIVMDAFLDNNENIYVGINDDDTNGILKLGMNGNLIASKSYPEDKYSEFNDFHFDHSYALVIGPYNLENQTFSLKFNNALVEEYDKKYLGEVMSYLRPFSSTTDGNSIWLSSYYINSVIDTTGFTISKLDQQGNVEWERTRKHDLGTATRYDLASDQNGNVIGLYGWRYTISSGFSVLLKYDPLGNELFTDTIPISSAGADFALDNSGNIFVSGFKKNAGKIFLRKYDSNGNQLWEKDYTKTDSILSGSVSDIQISANSTVYVVSSLMLSNGDRNEFILQFDEDGTSNWHRAVDSSNGTSPYLGDWHIDDQENITLVGGSQFGRTAVVSFDKDGNPLWSIFTDTLWSTSLAASSDGNIYVASFAIQKPYFNILKIDHSGNVLKSVDISMDQPGINYAVRNLHPLNDQLLASVTYQQASGRWSFLALIDQDLNLQEVLLDSMNPGILIQTMVDKDENIYSVSQHTATGVSATSYWTVVEKFSLNPVGRSKNKTTSDFRIYPNPTKSWLTISPGKEHTELEIILYDQLGRIIKRDVRQTQGNTQMNLSGLSPGLYLLEIKAGDQISISKVLKQ